MNELIESIYSAIVDGEMNPAKEAIQAALDAGLAPETILADGMIAAMKEVGALFEEGEIYVPEMLMSARAMQAGLAILKPFLMQSDIQASGKVVIGTVRGDVHDIGKNLVAVMFEGAGFEVTDLGVDVPPEKFILAIREKQADIVAMSALLTTTMPNMKVTIDALREAGLREQVKVMVGGAPVSESFAQQIGADGYAPDASRAVTVAHSLLQE